MKSTSTTHFHHVTPSVFRGIYTVIFTFLMTVSLLSQNSKKWEIGIGLHPLTLKETPYSFIAKKYISRSVSLRMGLSVIYNQDTKSILYNSPNLKNRLYYDYLQLNKNMYVQCFAGFQYGKKVKSIYLYSATDIFGGYRMEKSIIPNGINYYNDYQLVPNQFIETAFLPNRKILRYGVAQNLGIQYFINSNYSISVEGGVIYERHRLRSNDNKFAIQSDENASISYSYGFLEDKSNFWNYSIKLSPLTFLTINYLF